MNHCYRLIWNETRNTWVAVCEFARAHGKRSSGVAAPRPPLTPCPLPEGEGGLTGLGAAFAPAIKSLSLSLALAFAPAAIAAPDVNALPSGGQVAHGAAAISTAGSVMNITQTTQRAVLNWQNFDIGGNATVNFIQPNSSAVALNRVLGNNPSQIYGRLNANGHVFLLNPAGTYFAPGSQVNVGGLLASTLHMNDDDFMNGNYRLANPGGGLIEALGNINAGSVALVGNNITNSGDIVATTVSLVSGNAVAVDLTGNNLVRARIEDPALSASITNSGNIQAATITMTTGQARNAISSVVNNTGALRATSLVSKGGDIYLEAGTVSNSGSIDASGATGGGTIYLMGDMQTGQVNVGGTLKAEASPRPQAGEGVGERADGGFIETSAAHVKVSDSARVSTLAANGSNGTWLIDPYDFVIGPSGDITASAVMTALAGGNFSILSSGGGTTGSGDILVADALTWSANTLTLTAARNIIISAPVVATGASSLVMNTATANGGDAAVPDGAVIFFIQPDTGTFSGSLGFAGRSGSGFLTINGDNYTVINDLGLQGSTTGLDLQGIKGDLSGHYALGANIDASATSTWNSGYGFDPIGAFPSGFTGHFNGLGHTITSLVINRPADDFVGLFGYTQGADISNVRLNNTSINANGATGALAGIASSGSTLENVVVQASSITVDNATAGGVVGGLEGSNLIQGYVFTTTVTALGNAAGGLAGSMHGASAVREGAVSFSTITADSRAGGLVGAMYGASFIDSSLAENVHITVASSGPIGGILAHNGGMGSVTNSYYNLSNSSLSISSNTLHGVHPHGLYNTLFTDWVDNGKALTPIGDIFTFAGGYYQVDNLTDLQNMLGYLNGGYDFKLTSDIDLSSAQGFYLPEFDGTFYGDYHTISGLDLDRPDQDKIGFIGKLHTGSLLEYVGVTGDVNGNRYVGGLVGLLEGSISNSFFDGAVIGVEDVGGVAGRMESWEIHASYATGFVTGSYNVGGLVGSVMDGAIVSNSYSLATVTGNSGGSAVGGLAGYLDNLSSIEKSYAAGPVIDGGSVGDIGGLLGESGGGTVIASFWDITTSGQSTSAGGTGLVTAAMQTALTFTGALWDPLFWNMADGAYPTLLDMPGLPSCAYDACWIGGSGDWNTASNWYASHIPVAGDSVYINVAGTPLITLLSGAVNIGSLILDENFTFHSGVFNINGLFSLTGGLVNLHDSFTTQDFAMSGGTLGGTGSFAVTNSFSQSGGVINRVGAVNITQAIGALNFSAAYTGQLSLTALSGDIITSGNIKTRGGDVTLTAASGNISVHAITTGFDAGNAVPATSAGSITMGAGGNVSINSLDTSVVATGIVIGNGGNVNITTTGAVSHTGAGHFINTRVETDGNGSHTGNGGNVNITAGGGITATGDIETSVTKYQYGSNGAHGGDVTLSGSNVNVDDILTTVYQNDSGGTLGNGGNVSITATGDINVDTLNTLSHGAFFDYGSVTHVGNGGNVTLNAGGDLHLNGPVNTKAVLYNNSAGTGTVGVAGNVLATADNINLHYNGISARNMVFAANIAFNNTANAALNAVDGGRWLVYAASPANVIKGGLTSNFRHYGETYGSYATPVESGNGFIYASAAGSLTVAPTLSAGSASHIYGDSPTATYTYALTGFADSEDNASNIGIGGGAVFSVPTSASNAGSYNVAYLSGLTSSAGYNFSAGSTASYTVAKKTLTLGGATASNKVYDGTTAAAVSGTGTLSGLVGMETLTVNYTGALFSDKNAALGKTVTLNGLSLADGSGLASNYLLSATTTTATADITPRSLTVSGVAGVNKTFNGAAAASVNVLDDRITGDLLNYAASANFDTPDVGSGKLVTVSALSLAGGADFGNYTLLPPALPMTTFADILAAPEPPVGGSAKQIVDGVVNGILGNPDSTRTNEEDGEQNPFLPQGTAAVRLALVNDGETGPMLTLEAPQGKVLQCQ